MIVNWKGTGMMTCSPLPLGAECKSDTASLVPQVVFYPGWNQVSDEVWELCKPHMKIHFDQDLIEEKSKKDRIEDGVEVFVGIPFENIAARKESEALNLVKNCLNLQTLDAWEKETNRANLLNEIRVQRECISKGRDVRKDK